MMATQVFLFPDTQIAEEAFLEEVSSVLNTGEVPNLYSQEDKMDILEKCAKPANAAGFTAPNEVREGHCHRETTRAYRLVVR